MVGVGTAIAANDCRFDRRCSRIVSTFCQRRENMGGTGISLSSSVSMGLEVQEVYVMGLIDDI